MPSSTLPTGARPMVVVPLRAGKTRLSASLEPLARSELRAAMLSDVAAALRGAGLDEIVVAAGDLESADFARQLRLEVHRDPPDASSLDEALAAATSVAGPDEAVLIVTADLPALTSDDVRTVLAADGEVVLAPTRDGGTGALLRRPGRIMPTAYGLESAVLHAARAIDRGITPVVLDLAGFTVDVDTPDDLKWLADNDRLGQATRTWLTSSKVA